LALGRRRREGEVERSDPAGVEIEGRR
jgi:hypothetical protein